MVAPGREGNEWLSRVAPALGLHLAINPVDIGVRVELPAEVLEPLTNIVYEPKLYYYSKSFRRSGAHVLRLPLWRGDLGVGRGCA